MVSFEIGCAVWNTIPSLIFRISLFSEIVRFSPGLHTAETFCLSLILKKSYEKYQIVAQAFKNCTNHSGCCPIRVDDPGHGVSLSAAQS